MNETAIIDLHASGSRRGLLADRVAAHIRHRIAAGQLAPGERLNEVEIAQELNISRGPVREAIKQLASSGLVVSEPNLGSRVVKIDEVGVRHLYEVREALESMSARLAAQRMSAAQKDQLLKMLDEHEAAMDGDGSDAYPAGTSDWDFHLAVLAGGGNEVAWRICGSDLRDMLSLLRARHGRAPGRGRRALQEHRWVAEAIAAGDADLAGLLMAQHIRHSYQNLQRLIENSQEEGVVSA
ncbi:GntR family transcriptional regulator [Faunimonas sp. B44]|uniref:GntR family transcriptional regulator n=1 Tax=Faunimonas sp. B44 TaxID=3461493 RepID=UPI0040446330